MKTDTFLIIGAAVLGLGLIYHATKKPAAPATGAGSYASQGTTIGSAAPTLSNVFGTAGTGALGSGLGKVFGTDPYGVYGASTIGAANDGTISSLLQTGGIMGAFQ